MLTLRVEFLIRDVSFSRCGTDIDNFFVIFLCNIFHKLSDVHTRVLRDTKCNLVVPKMRTAYGQKSFAFLGAKAWNELDSEMKLAPSIQSFKTKIKALN